MQKKFIYIGGAIILVVAFLGWLFYASTKPLPGQKQAYDCSNFLDFSKLTTEKTDDKCRVHIPPETAVKYPTNPPTHGPHYGDWVRAGVYTDPKDDRNMVHSLEHGYVILSYKCNLPTLVIPSDSEESVKQIATSSASPIPRNDNRVDSQAECDQRKSQLEAIYEKKGKRKLIVVARPNLDTNFALAAWTYLDKFNDFDPKRVERFIDAHFEMGPEKTME